MDLLRELVWYNVEDPRNLSCTICYTPHTPLSFRNRLSPNDPLQKIKPPSRNLPSPTPHLHPHRKRMVLPRNFYKLTLHPFPLQNIKQLPTHINRNHHIRIPMHNRRSREPLLNPRNRVNLSNVPTSRRENSIKNRPIRNLCQRECISGPAEIRFIGRVLALALALE